MGRLAYATRRDDLRKRGYGPGNPLLVVVHEELEMVVLEELEIVPLFDPPEI